MGEGREASSFPARKETTLKAREFRARLKRLLLRPPPGFGSVPWCSMPGAGQRPEEVHPEALVRILLLPVAAFCSDGALSSP